MKTRTSERIRIRDRSGLIKGPFKRGEVVGLIRERKIDGEEEIFLESEGRWKPIAADTEFFDLIQEVLFGIKSATQTGASSKGVWTGSFEENVGDSNIDLTEKLPTQVQHKSQMTVPTQVNSTKTVPLTAEEQELLLEVQKSKLVPQPVETPVSAPPPTPQHSRAPTPVTPPPKAPPAEKQIQGFGDIDAPEKKKRFKGLPLILVTLLLAGLGIYLMPEQKVFVGDVDKINLQFDLKHGYFRPLLLRLRLMSPLELPPQGLKNDIERIKVLPLNVHDLMLKEEEFSRKPEERVNASTWVYKAWLYRVLGDVIAAGDTSKGAEIRGASEAILLQLNSQGVMNSELKALFASLDQLLDGEVGKAYESLKQLQSPTLVGELYRRELSYWATLGGMDNATSSPLMFEDLSELSVKYRYEEELRQKVTKSDFEGDFLKTAEKVLAQDSHSLLTWFLIGKYYSIKFPGGPAVTNRYFFTGLCQASLWPRTLQAMYWRVYSQFLAKSSPKDSERLATTADLIEVGEYDKNAASVDIDDPSFRFKALLDTYKKAFEENEMNPIELASFEILSEASIDAKSNLVSVLISPLLDKNWSVAERRLRMVEKTFPFDFDVKTLHIWLEGERFRFERAQQILSESFGAGSGTEYVRAEGILHILGRDYEGGTDILRKYLETNAQDGLTFFFLARGAFESEKYTDCVKYSNLSLMNSVGPLRLRSQTMNYRCRVLAQLGTDEALRNFAQFISQFPATSISREEYVRALLDADRSQEAVKIAEKLVVENPYSPNLKILLGEVYEKRGALNEALALYNEARRLDPSSARAAVHVADLFYKDRRYKEAAQNYVAAGAQDLELPEIFLKAARAYRKAGNLNEAQEMYFKEIDLRPAVLDTFLEGAEFLLESNRPGMVPNLFGRFSEDFRSDPRVLTRLAQAYIAIGDKKNARMNAELAVKQNPTEAEPYRILGQIFDADGQYPLAKSNYEKYLVLVPQAPDADLLKKKLALPPY